MPALHHWSILYKFPPRDGDTQQQNRNFLILQTHKTGLADKTQKAWKKKKTPWDLKILIWCYNFYPEESRSNFCLKLRVVFQWLTRIKTSSMIHLLLMNMWSALIVKTIFTFIAFNWCCNNCPRDDCPRRQLSKGLLSNDTVVQADFCPRRLLSKEAFTSKKLSQIDFSFCYWDLPYKCVI